MNKQTFLGLPSYALNAISTGATIFIVFLGAKVYKSADLALEVANTKLVTSNKADRLQELAQELDKQAEIIKQKEQAYENLHQTYKKNLSRVRGFEKLKKSIDSIEDLPEVENIEAIQKEISITEEILEEVGSE